MWKIRTTIIQYQSRRLKTPYSRTEGSLVFNRRVPVLRIDVLLDTDN